MNPKDDDTSLGNILLEIGMITEEQLEKAVERQQNSSIEQMLGMVLVHEGYCTKETIEDALSMQASMRKGRMREADKAMCAIDYAIKRKKSNGAREVAIRKGAVIGKVAGVIRSATGSEYVAITSEMVAKAAKEG